MAPLRRAPLPATATVRRFADPRDAEALEMVHTHHTPWCDVLEMVQVAPLCVLDGTGWVWAPRWGAAPVVRARGDHLFLRVSPAPLPPAAEDGGA
eukprot:gene14228-37778_t